MKELFLTFIAIISLNIFASTQKIVCKERTEYADYDVTLIFTLSGKNILNAVIEYSGTDLIEGLYSGQVANDSLSSDMTIKLVDENIVITGKGWNPSYDEPNFYAVKIPSSYIGVGFDKDEKVVFLSALDGQDDSEKALETIFNVKCVSTIY
jgi:hypothetical protein